MKNASRHAAGFTLVELLVVVAIMTTLLSIIMPGLTAARAEAMRVVCQSNLRQLGLASEMYVSDHRGHYWRYYQNTPDGRRWWFGFEPGGPGSGSERPLDQSRGALGPYLNTTDDLLECPSFPYNDGGFFQKFTARSASYAYNLHLGPVSQKLPTARQGSFQSRLSSVVLFADGIHFDFGSGFNEGHYMMWNNNALAPSGYAHFRHANHAQMVMLDGHVTQQQHTGPAFRIVGGGPAGNLTSHDGTNRIYGFD